MLYSKFESLYSDLTLDVSHSIYSDLTGSLVFMSGLVSVGGGGLGRQTLVHRVLSNADKKKEN